MISPTSMVSGFSIGSMKQRLPALKVGSILLPRTGINGSVPLMERKPTIQAAIIDISNIARFILFSKPCHNISGWYYLLPSNFQF